METRRGGICNKQLADEVVVYFERTKTGCYKIPSKVYGDQRGVFTELYKSSTHDELPDFKQVNFSISKKGVVRGMHAQRHNPQAKWIRLLAGEIIDCVIDMRINSSTFGQMESFHLKALEYSLFIPAGFVHGFWCLDDCHFLYHCTTEYDFASDGGISPVDPDIEYPWQGQDVTITDKDRSLPMYRDYNSSFRLGD